MKRLLHEGNPVSQQGGSMHRTGMHSSCLVLLFVSLTTIKRWTIGSVEDLLFFFCF